MAHSLGAARAPLPCAAPRASRAPLGCAQGEMFKMAESLYALDKWVVRPVTCPEPDVREAVPAKIREAAGLPEAQHKCSFSELVNPGGVLVDAFVSHFWGHPFEDTMAVASSASGAAPAHADRGIAETVCVVPDGSDWGYLRKRAAGEEGSRARVA